MNGNTELDNREQLADNGVKPISRKTSRLDLIDNTQLTSFPLAHPIGEEGNNLIAGEKYESPFTSDLTIKDKENRQGAKSRSSIGKSKWNARNRAQRHSRKRPLEEVNEGEPLVLVEDYIEDTESICRKLQSKRGYPQAGSGALKGHKFRKRISVLDFKESMKQENSSCSMRKTSTGPYSLSSHNCRIEQGSPSETLKFASLSLHSLDLKHKASAFSTISTLSSVISGHEETEPYVREVIEEQPSMARESGRLKYCVICERPLYAASSLIPANRDFKELVCSDCFEEYENVWGSLKAMYLKEVGTGENQGADNVADFPSGYLPTAQTGEGGCFVNNHTFRDSDTLSQTPYPARVDDCSANHSSHSDIQPDGTFSNSCSGGECSMSRASPDTYRSDLLERTIRKLRLIKKRDDSIRDRLLNHQRSTLSTWIRGSTDNRDNRPMKKWASMMSTSKLNMHN